MSKIYNSSNSLSSIYNVEVTGPIQNDVVFSSINDLFTMKYPHYGKIVSIVGSDTGDGVYVLTSNDIEDIKETTATLYLLDLNKEECKPTYDESWNIAGPGISHYYGWKKIGEGSGGGSGIDVEDNEGATTKGTTINNDGDVTGTVENGSITLNIDWSKIECICGGNSVAGDTTITDGTGTSLTIDNYTLKKDPDGDESAEDDNTIYVALTDGGTWTTTEDKTE